MLVSNNVSYGPLCLVNWNNAIQMRKLWQNGGRGTEYADETKANLDRLKRLFDSDIYTAMKSAEPDIVLVDLVDFRLGAYVIDFGDCGKISIGINSLKTDNISRLVRNLEESLGVKATIKTIQMNELSDDELENYIKLHIDRLYEVFDSKNLIFIKPRLVCNYIDGNDIKYTPMYWVQGTTNDMIDRIYRLADKYITYIDAPDFLIGDSSCLKPFEYHFCQPYYDYMIDAIKHIIDGNEIDESIEHRRMLAGREIFESYNSIFCNQIVENLVNRNLLDKRIVLIARNDQFNEILKDRYKREIYDWIYYDKDYNIDEIKVFVENDINQCGKENIIFAVPEIFNNGKGNGTIYSLLTKFEFICNVNWFKYKSPEILSKDNFVGKFIDVFNNEIEAKSLIKLTIQETGNILDYSKNKLKSEIKFNCGSTIVVGDSLKEGLNASLSASWDAYILIGKNNTSAGQVKIFSSLDSRVEIGDDVMFSTDIMVRAGDGHAFFQYIDGKPQIISDKHNRLYLGSHVWIGFNSKLLSGTSIEDGCIVGACSLVNKKFPNNVAIAGIPARVIRKDVVWCRSVMIQNLEQDKYVLENFANQTDESY
ncbi:MAG: acyltransferase [Pseudobutyrivibrio sp.]|uniref:hypothetical protein n=1 Tax=Pseudobutyrivibrio sp. TaxID=2014367 RepID=UPI0025E3FA3C|nr:hypothetical protein [Pseudobutyrivibrio sp.]MBQ6463548.1 acyltransferase [Pseudobutyrivibrio sp.]